MESPSSAVFVVDDERLIADTTAMILRINGYEAIAFYDPESVLKQLDSNKPDIVISDVIMPGMNGVDLAVLIRERCPDCRIVLFSGQAATNDLLEEARRKGNMFEILQKPILPADLLAKIAA
jgi:DNA-binding NtrC family response regulator